MPWTSKFTRRNRTEQEQEQEQEMMKESRRTGIRAEQTKETPDPVCEGRCRIGEGPRAVERNDNQRSPGVRR